MDSKNKRYRKIKSEIYVLLKQYNRYKYKIDHWFLHQQESESSFKKYMNYCTAIENILAQLERKQQHLLVETVIKDKNYYEVGYSKSSYFRIAWDAFRKFKKGVVSSGKLLY